MTTSAADRQSDAARLARLRRWAELLDSAFKVPGLPVRFGLDAVAGLVPGVGELTTPAFTLLLLSNGLRAGVPLRVLMRMVVNTAVDALIGLVPVIGDITDIGWKANLRNLALLEAYARSGAPMRPRDTTWVVVAGVILLLLVVLVAIVPILLVIWVLAWIIGERGLL
jgi:hypothetical protein